MLQAHVSASNSTARLNQSLTGSCVADFSYILNKFTKLLPVLYEMYIVRLRTRAMDGIMALDATATSKPN